MFFPDADTPRFFLTLDGQNDFGVYAFRGREAVHEPYEFVVEAVHRSASVPTADFLGKEALLSIADNTGVPRLVHGLMREMRQLHTANAVTHYQCVIVPRLWFLDLVTDHRIFQNLSVVEIIRMILTEQGFTDETVAFKLCYAYEPREYCVQYGESALHFISRLCEEEGIYFYFEHKEDSHILCFCDREGGPKISGESDIRFFPGSGQRPDSAVISRARLRRNVVSNAASYREWNFEQPKLSLAVGDYEPEHGKAPAPSGMFLERYRWPHLYRLRAAGTRYARLQLARQLAFTIRLECESDVSRYLPSYTFTVHDHPRGDVNARWWVVAVIHEGEQPGVLEHEAPDGRGLRYKSTVTAIPEMTRLVPALAHPKRLVKGRQTAVVTGPENGEIYPDQYGRVKVQFFWDRQGRWDENTTCWIRVSQAWAGSLYGTEVLPRVGHEVVVSFLDGDPDRPLITGRVYHELNRTPYALPEHKTRTVFKSMSTPGEEGEARGFNELRIEDKKGVEEVYAHAEKDTDIHIKNDRRDHILHDGHRTVDNFGFVKIKGEAHTKVEGRRKSLIDAEDHHTVRGASHGAVDGRWLARAGEEIHLESLMKAVLEAGADLTLKVGPSFVHIAGGDIEIVGPTITINAGGEPGVGTPARPLLPKGAVPPDVPPSPKCSCLRLTALERGPLCVEMEN